MIYSESFSRYVQSNKKMIHKDFTVSFGKSETREILKKKFYQSDILYECICKRYKNITGMCWYFQDI